MTMKFRDSGNTLRTAAALKFRDTGNALRAARTIKMRDASNVLRTVFTSMSVAATPSSASGTLGSFGPGAITVTSNTVSVGVSGGTPPYSHSWAYFSGSADIGATDSSSSSTAFSASVDLGDTLSGTWVDTITDANGATASIGVSISLHHADLN